MRRSHALRIAALLVATTALAAPAKHALQERLSYDVHFLASDALEGRKAGSVDAHLAADFIARRFAALGLEPRGVDGYIQPFSFIAGVHPGPGNALRVDLAAGPRTASMPAEFQPLAFSASGTAAGEVVFAGYGIHAGDLDYDDYAGLDVKGKIVLVLRFGPDGNDPNSRFQPYMALRRKAADAREAGAAALLVATGPVTGEKGSPVKISFDASFADSGLPVLAISTDLASAMFESQGFTLADLERRIDERKQPASRPLGVSATLTADVVQEHAEGHNVLGFLPGADPALRDQVIVIGAHFDHLGWGGEGSGSLVPEQHAIHNGADDNASGTAGMLEIARQLAAHPPARGVLFAAFSGEEEGLLGSQHLVTHLPVPAESVVAMLNLDMIGRPKPGPALTLGGFGTAKEWPDLIARVNANHHLKLATNKGGFGASDHSSFYGKDIPVLFFFTGAHEDYHKPSDDADRLNYPGMAEVVTFAADTARAVADLPQRPTFERVAEEEGGGRRGFAVRTGAIPEYGYDGPGVRLSGTRGGSPADRAGLKGGDVVIKFGDRDVRNIYDYMYALGDHKAGDTVVLTVKRGDTTLEIPVTLEAATPRGT